MRGGWFEGGGAGMSGWLVGWVGLGWAGLGWGRPGSALFWGVKGS